MNQYLIGEVFWNEGFNVKGEGERSFNYFILNPLYKLITGILGLEGEKLDKFLLKINLKIS